MGVLGCRIEEIWRSEEKNASGLDAEPEKGIGVSGVRVSAVMVTGRQKVEGSVVKRLKASWSSGETVGFVVSLGRGIFGQWVERVLEMDRSYL